MKPMPPDDKTVTLVQKKPLKVKEVMDMARLLKKGNNPVETGIARIDQTTKEILKVIRSNGRNLNIESPFKIPKENRLVSKTPINKPGPSNVKHPYEKFVSKTPKTPIIWGVQLEERTDISDKPLFKPKSDASTLNKTKQAAGLRQNQTFTNITEKVKATKAAEIANERMSSHSAKKTGEVVASSIQDQAEKNRKRDSLLLNNIDRMSSASDAAGMAMGGPVFQAMKEGAELLKSDKDSVSGRLMGKLNDKTGVGDKVKNVFGKIEEKTGIKKAHTWLYGDEKERANKKWSADAKQNLEDFSKLKEGRFKDDKGKFITREKAIALQKQKEVDNQGKYSKFHSEESISKIKKKTRIEQREKAKISVQKPILQKVKQEKPKLISKEQNNNIDSKPLFQNREKSKSDQLLSDINDTLIENDKDLRKRDKDRDKVIKKSRSSSDSGFSIFDMLPGRKGKGGFLRKILGKAKVGRFAGKAGGLISKVGGVLGLGGIGAAISRGGSAVAKGGGMLARGSGFLAKGGIKMAGRLAGKLPIIGALVTAGMAVWDFADGMDMAAQLTGKAEKDLTGLEKIQAGTANALSGLTFGLLSTETAFKGVQTVSDFFEGRINNMTGAFDNLVKLTGKSAENITAMDKAQAAFSSVVSAITFGIVDSKIVFEELEKVTTSLSKNFDKVKGSIGRKFDKITQAFAGRVNKVGDILERFGDKINRRLAKIAGKDVNDMTTEDKIKAGVSQTLSTLSLGILNPKENFEKINSIFPTENQQKSKQDALKLEELLQMKKNWQKVNSPLNKIALAPKPPKRSKRKATLTKKPSQKKPTTVDRIDKAAKMIKETTKSSEKIIERNNNTMQEKLKPVYTDADRIPVPLHQRAGTQALLLQGK